jgi:hypothetical protein
LPLGNIRTPSLPVSSSLAIGLETLLLFTEVFLVLNEDHDGCEGWWCIREEL